MAKRIICAFLIASLSHVLSGTISEELSKVVMSFFNLDQYFDPPPIKCGNNLIPSKGLAIYL